MASAETNSVRVRMSGVARSSAEAHAQRSDAYLSGLGSERAVPMPRRFEPLYVDDAGASYLIRPGADGPVAIPFAAPPKGTPWEQEGLLPFPDPPPPGTPQPPREPGPFDMVKNEIRDWAKSLPSQMGQAVVKQALMNAFLGQGTSGLLGAALGPLGGVLGGLAPAVGALGSMLGNLSASSGGADALGFVAGGCFPGMGSGADAKPILPGGCFPGGTSGVDVSIDLSATLGQLGSQLMSQWKVEDSDATGEQLAHHFAEKWKDKLSDPEGTLKKLKAFFAPTAAPALFPALRVGDVDVAGDAVAAGSPTVFAEGLPVARVTDAVAPPGMQVYMGGATVLTNGMMTGRALTSMSMIGPFPKGAATVFVNGAAGGAPPPPPPPPLSTNAASADGAKKAEKPTPSPSTSSHDAKKSPPAANSSHKPDAEAPKSNASSPPSDTGSSADRQPTPQPQNTNGDQNVDPLEREANEKNDLRRIDLDSENEGNDPSATAEKAPPKVIPGQTVLLEGGGPLKDRTSASELATTNKAELRRLDAPGDLSTVDRVIVNTHITGSETDKKVGVYENTTFSKNKIDSMTPEDLATSLTSHGFHGSEVELVVCLAGESQTGPSFAQPFADAMPCGTTVVAYTGLVTIDRPSGTVRQHDGSDPAPIREEFRSQKPECAPGAPASNGK